MKTLTKQELLEIEAQAKELRALNRKASIGMVTDFDEELGGYVIEEAYISTSGMWIYTEKETNEYVKQIKECQDFLNTIAEYVKYRKD